MNLFKFWIISDDFLCTVSKPKTHKRFLSIFDQPVVILTLPSTPSADLGVEVGGDGDLAVGIDAAADLGVGVGARGDLAITSCRGGSQVGVGGTNQSGELRTAQGRA